MGQMSSGTTVQWDKCPSGTNVPVRQMSSGTNVRGTNVQWDSCQVGQMSCGTIVSGTVVTPPSQPEDIKPLTFTVRAPGRGSIAQVRKYKGLVQLDEG